MKASRHHSSRIPTATNIALTETVDGATIRSVSHSAVTNTATYDAYRRETVRTDGRGNATTNAYDTLGRLASVTGPLGATTSYAYDAIGNLVAVTNALGNATIYEYDLRGNKTYEGGATYPVRYAYDDYNVMTNMTTYRNESLQSGDTTTWLYDEPTGLLTNKVYADGKGPAYTYTIDGKLATRTWARGITTDYSYDGWGNLTNTVYSDGTPTISLFYDALGRQTEAHDAAGVTTFNYDSFGSLTNEIVIGVAGTNTIIRHWDNYGRSLGYSLVGRAVPSAPQRQSTLAYDSATGRLATMLANGSDTPFTWSYLSGSDLKSSLAYPNGLTASWTYDANNQLLQVCNAFPTNIISQYDYTCDAIGRRVSCAKSGSAFVQNDTLSYGYNNRSELTNVVAAVDSNYRYAYGFDDIGNRESSCERGSNTVYTANNLNQYNAVDDFMPQFDDDGNQTLIKTATGIWSVTYNGENRPILWTCTQSNNQTITNNQTISMSYDRMGRRVTKNDQRFFYDGYLQIANFEQSVSNSQLITHNLQLFIWDPTEPVATRPLVWNYSTFQPFNVSTSYYSHDGNKNVSEVISAGGAVTAHYEYAPFGAVIRKSGDLCRLNPWCFSSEYEDGRIAVVYYNYRHYEILSGRWMNRDPMEESYAGNLYVMVANAPSTGFDFLGEKCKVKWIDHNAKLNRTMYGWSLYGGIRYKTSKKVTTISAEELNTAARVLYAEAKGGTKGRVTREQIAIASTMYNRVGKYKKMKLFDSLKAVVQNKAEYNGYDSSKYHKALPNAYQRLDKFECCDLKSAIQAIQEVFLLKKEVENYTNFQIGGDGTAIGAHRFSVSSDWSEYQNGDISILNYKTKAELQSMTLKKFKVKKGFQAVKWFKEQFGYSEGATQLLEKWNPDVDFKKLKIGKAVMLMQ